MTPHTAPSSKTPPSPPIPMPQDGTKNELIKASAAIQISNRLSLLQRKLGNALLRHAFYRLEECETHSINISLLAERVNFDSKNVEALKEAISNLAKTTVEFNLMGKDKRPIWGISTVLSQAIIRDSVLFYAYPPFMRGSLRHPDIYAKLNLSVQNCFRSKHALALWEFFTDYLGSKRNTCETDFIFIEQYRSLLGIDDADYQDFRDFNKRLIKDPIQEINEVSDIQIELPPIFKRNRRRIEAMRFQVMRKSQLLMEYEVPDEEINSANHQEVLKERMMNLGFTSRVAQAALKRYESPYIEENLRVVEKRISQGDIESPAALLSAALRDDYRVSKSSPVQPPPEQRQKSLTRAAQRTQALELLEEIFSETTGALVTEAFEVASPDKQVFLQKEFLYTNKDKTFILDRFKRNGIRSPFLWKMFQAFAREHLLPHPWQHSLEAFIAHMNQQPGLDPKVRKALDVLNQDVQ